MTKGPHIFDNLYAEMADEAEWGVLEVEQNPDAEQESHLVAGVILVPESRRALVVKAGFEGEDAWAQVSKIDTATGEEIPTQVVIDGVVGDAEVLAHRTDVC